MVLHRGEAARPKTPTHHVAASHQPTACGTAWSDLPFHDLTTTDRRKVTCQPCEAALVGGFRVLRTLPSLDGPTIVASDPIPRDVALARFDEMVAWGMDRVRVVREQDFQTGVR